MGGGGGDVVGVVVVTGCSTGPDVTFGSKVVVGMYKSDDDASIISREVRARIAHNSREVCQEL
jgi:hypothetical protein